MTLFIGWLLLCFSVIWGVGGFGGGSAIHFRATDLIIMAGSAFGAFVAANRRADLKSIGRLMRQFLLLTRKRQRQRCFELMCLMFDLLQLAQVKGVRSLEQHVFKPEQSPLFQKYPLLLEYPRLVEFITDSLRLISDGSASAGQLKQTLEHELELIENESSVPIRSLQWIGDAMPAFGIVAAITGMVHALNNIGKIAPSEIGLQIAASMTGTLCSLLLGYGIVMPMSRRLEKIVQSEMNLYSASCDILMAHSHKFTPMVAVEYGRRQLTSDHRPSMQQLEQALRSSATGRRLEPSP